MVLDHTSCKFPNPHTFTLCLPVLERKGHMGFMAGFLKGGRGGAGVFEVGIEGWGVVKIGNE